MSKFIEFQVIIDDEVAYVLVRFEKIDCVSMCNGKTRLFMKDGDEYSTFVLNETYGDVKKKIDRFCAENS